MLRIFFSSNRIAQKWRKITLVLIFITVLLGVVLSQWLNVGAVSILPEPPAVLEIEESQFDQPISPLPTNLKFDEQKVELGRRLFHDKRLSRGDRFACVSCHDLSMGGADGLPQSIGQDGKPLAMNAPTILNSAYNFRQFWDGRVITLEAQVSHPLNAPNELGLTWAEAIAKIQQDPDYKARFAAVYHQRMNPEVISDAIANFQRSLITPSRFDQFLRGDVLALTAQEQAGYDKFKSYGCVACHQGVNLGGNMFQSLGVMVDYFSTLGEPKHNDQGRMNVTSDVRDRNVFKVPTLRNVAETAPYLHDGHVATLPEVVRIMAKYQLGRAMPDQDVDDLVAFLQSLSGHLPEVARSDEKQTRGGV